MRGKRRRWSGHDFWQLGPVSVFSRRGETLWPSGDVGQGEMAGRGRSKRRSRTGLARVCGGVRLAGWRVSCRRVVRLGVESLAAVPGRD